MWGDLVRSYPQLVRAAEECTPVLIMEPCDP